MSHSLHWNEQGTVAEVVLDAPNKNSLHRQALHELHSILDTVRVRDSARAVIITGADGNFCGGRIPTPGLVTTEEIRADLAPILTFNQLLEGYPIPLIAAVEGAAFGFGFGLATLCDLTIVGDDAQFALTELAHGIPPLIVLSYFFRFVPYKIAFDLALTGRCVSAQEAQQLGLATTVVPAGGSLTQARELAAQIAELDRGSVLLLRSFARRNASLVDESAASDGADQIAALLASRLKPEHHSS